MDTTYDTIVVGGGQAGLAAGYFLAQQGRSFAILDENAETGVVWRGRWDSLRLFTPSQFDGLPGTPFAKPDYYFPTKDETADYLASYAEAHRLPVHHGVRVEGLRRNGTEYEVTAGDATFRAPHVIVATGPYQHPYTPTFGDELGSSTFQIHSNAYHNPDQVPAARVLVVGAGNSGVEIALELARAGRQVWLAGRDVGRIPAESLGKLFGGRLFWWIVSRVMSVNTPVGRRMRPRLLTRGAPLMRFRPEDLIEAGVERTPRLSGIESGTPRLEDGRSLPVEGVIWATGYRPDFGWIDLPIFDARGNPRQERGIVRDAPGLYFLGLLFQTSMTSALLGGVGADAKVIVEHLIAH